MIRILTDSTADFSPKEAQQLGITVVPLQVNFGTETYRDGVDLTPAEFYEKLESAEKLPTTSQPGISEFLDHFEAAKQAGDTLICVLISSALSGTYQSAVLAKAECCYDNIYLVDSGNATLAAHLLVRRALQRMNEGMSAEEIVADLEEAKTRLHLFAVVGTLKYLHKGGRLSGVAAIAGSLLGIKPVVHLGCGEKVTVSDKARGLPGAYLAIFKQIERLGGIDDRFGSVIGYSGDRKGLEPFARFVTQNLGLSRPTVTALGAVIGVHAGPGACGIAFFANENEKNA